MTFANVVSAIALFVALGAGASAIDSKGPSGGTSAKRINFRGSAIDPAPPNPFAKAAHGILKLGELRVRTSCIDTGGSNARILVAFGSPGKANIEWGYHQFNNPGASSEITGSAVDGSWYPVIDLQGALRSADGQVIFSNKRRTITVSLHAFMNGGEDGLCTVRGTALNASG